MGDLSWIDDFVPSINGIALKAKREYVKHLNDPEEGDLIRTPSQVASELDEDVGETTQRKKPVKSVKIRT